MTANGNSPKLQITCPTCGQVFSVVTPMPEIANNLFCSVATISHEKLTFCSNNKCRQAFVLIAQGVQFVINAQPVGSDVVEKVQGTKIITPTLGLVQ